MKYVFIHFKYVSSYHQMIYIYIMSKIKTNNDTHKFVRKRKMCLPAVSYRQWNILHAALPPPPLVTHTQSCP